MGDEVKSGRFSAGKQYRFGSLAASGGGSVMHRLKSRTHKIHALGKKINAERQPAGRTPSRYNFTRLFGECTTDDRRPVGQRYQ
jgi:hypothetical protein